MFTEKCERSSQIVWITFPYKAVHIMCFMERERSSEQSEFSDRYMHERHSYWLIFLKTLHEGEQGA